MLSHDIAYDIGPRKVKGGPLEPDRNKRLLYTLVYPDNPRDHIPPHFFGQSDWPAEIASLGLQWSKKSNGTYRIDRGLSDAFLTDEECVVSLPQSIDGIPITEITSFAFTVLIPARTLRNEPAALEPTCASLVIPDGVESIGNCAILGLNPREVCIPASVRRIGNLGFYASKTESHDISRSFVVDKNNRHFRSIEGSLYTYKLDALICQAKPYPSVVSIPDNVQRLSVCAFTYGSKLPDVILAPDGLTKIVTVPNRECLWVCSQGSQTYTLAQRKGYYAVTDRYGCENGFVYDVLNSGEASLVRYRGNTRDVVVPEQFAGHSLISVGINAFPPHVESISFPDTVLTIAGHCFASELKRIKLPSQVRTIGNDTFSDARFVEPVIIPKSCNSVGKGSFKHATCFFEGYDAFVHLNSEPLVDCFTEGSPPFDFARYDENILRLRSYKDKLHAILMRIAHPFRLSKDSRAAYITYLQGRAGEVIDRLIQSGDLSILSALIDAGFFTSSNIDSCIKGFSDAHYTPGIICLIDFRHTALGACRKDRFAL